MSETGASLQEVDGQWRVSGELTVDSVTEVLETSRDLDLPESGVVDLQAAGHADSAAVALLLAWKRRAEVEHKPLTFAALPATLTSLASLYGVESFLGI